MLRFESVFWANKDPQKLVGKLKALGFNAAPSTRDSDAQAIYFGPEAIEIFSNGQEMSTLGDRAGDDGIFGLGLESDSIGEDYNRLKKTYTLEKPKAAKDSDKEIPLWYGFVLPDNSLALHSWVVMNSPYVLNQQAAENLPLTHPNTCFGIESVHVMTSNPEDAAQKWSQVIEKSNAGLQWNEQVKTSGRRLQSGERFLDLLTPSSSKEGVFMLTLKVRDLEKAKAQALEAGAKVTGCVSRDGFIVPADYTGGPALRFIRHAWKRYLPTINDFYPFGRRPDQFRPLGGAYSSTLRDGFEDNWDY